MRYFYCLVFLIMPIFSHATEWEDRQLFSGDAGSETLRIISSTDTAVFKPILDNFLLRNPTINVDYSVTSSAEVDKRFRQSPDAFDLAISSAMDLQLKLVNDGFARQLKSITHPDWARWRQSLFGFTLEPASIVVNRNVFESMQTPTTRQEMIEVLRENPEIFKDRIGTYDIRRSGLGYLFATQDARASETYWRLTEIMGSLETKLYCCSAEMIEDLAKGEIAIAYNVLGSYAMARRDLSQKLIIIQPKDFPNTMMRTALISNQTPHFQSALTFLRFLTSSDWSQPNEGTSFESIRGATLDEQRSIITLEPGLMIFLDKLKRNSFIHEWENAIIQ